LKRLPWHGWRSNPGSFDLRLFYLHSSAEPQWHPEWKNFVKILFLYLKLILRNRALQKNSFFLGPV
jgi:hypothetical protein